MGSASFSPLAFLFSPADVDLVAVVANHLLALVGDVGAHGREPFLGVEGSVALSTSGFIDDLVFPRKIGHAVLRKGSADDVLCRACSWRASSDPPVRAFTSEGWSLCQCPATGNWARKVESYFQWQGGRNESKNNVKSIRFDLYGNGVDPVLL